MIFIMHWVYKLHVKSLKATKRLSVKPHFKIILYNKRYALPSGRLRLLKISSSIEIINALEVVCTGPNVVKGTLRSVLDSVVVLFSEL